MTQKSDPVFWTKEEIQECLELLSQVFGVPVPRLKVTGGHGGMYVPLDSTVRIGRRTVGGSEFGVLHEFAHHLDFCRNGLGPKRFHGEVFFKCLVEVVKAWFGDPVRYLWKYEYQVIQRRAFRAAYLAKPPKPKGKEKVYVKGEIIDVLPKDQLASLRRRFEIVVTN